MIIEFDFPAYPNEAMSVPESKRAEGELKVITKSRELTARTLRICSNEKHFPKRLRWCFTSHICKECNEMLSAIIKANSVYVLTEEDAQLRIRYWREALAFSSSFAMYIDLAMEMAEVKLDTIRSWRVELEEVRNLIRSRINSETKRYRCG